MLASQAKGKSRAYNLLRSLDVLSALDCLRKLGVKVILKKEFCEIEGRGLNGFKVKNNTVLNAGNSGTLGRLILGLLVHCKSKTIYKLSSAQLKSCGLSRQKVRGIKNLANQILDKSFNPRLIPKMSDEDAIIYLSQLRQIGRWSAEMILLFTYNRSNIWPIQDIGLLRAISKNYKKKYLPPENYVKLLNKRFSPYCSVATWYLWRSIDPEPIQY